MVNTWWIYARKEIEHKYKTVEDIDIETWSMNVLLLNMSKNMDNRLWNDLNAKGTEVEDYATTIPV
jgi:hypothetical protein